MNRLKFPKVSRRLMQNLVLIGVLLILVVFFTSKNPRFFANRNFINIVRQILPAVLMGCSMTFVINSGAIDLSVGGVMALSAVMFGIFVKWGVDVWLAIVLVCVLGMAVGALNTFLVHGLKLPAIMATMATWIASSGMAFTICSAIAIQDPRMKPITVLNGTMFFDNKVPLAAFIILAVVAVFIFLEKKTIVGKYAIAMGGNENAAFLSGINVAAMHLIYFMLSGMMAALSAMWQVSRIGSGEPNIGTGMEFTVIAGCLLGGVSIKGGDGTIAGMLIGTVILALLTNGMNMLNINAFYQQVAIGVVLLLAVLVNYGADVLRLSQMRRRKLPA